MSLSFMKLGTLALRTLSKPVANRLKKQAAINPKFRTSIIGIAQVAGAVVIFEVQRSARSEAKKEEIRKQEIEDMRQRDEDLSKQVELLNQKLNKLEQVTKEKALENGQTKDVKGPISSS